MSKHYVVIGGTSGIGLETVRQLDQNDDKIYVLSRSHTDQLQELNHVEHYPCDILQLDSTLPTFDFPIDGLAYFPGTINLKPISALQIDDFKKEWETNLLGAVRVIKHFLPGLKKAPHSSVVLMSTVAVHYGMPFHASTASAKGAVEGLTRALAAELAPTIRVNAVAPSLTDTPLASSLLNTETKREHAVKRHPLEKIGTPQDIANIVTFLLSEKSAWMTGQIIGINGGLGSVLK